LSAGAGESHDGDAGLLRRMRAGDAEAAREVVDRWGDRLFRAALAVIGSRQTAEDIVQETFLKALRKSASERRRSGREAAPGPAIAGPPSDGPSDEVLPE